MYSRLYNKQNKVARCAVVGTAVLAATIIMLCVSQKMIYAQPEDDDAYMYTVKKVGANPKGVSLLLGGVYDNVDQIASGIMYLAKQMNCKQCEHIICDESEVIFNYFKVRIEYSAQMWYDRMSTWVSKTLSASYAKLEQYNANMHNNMLLACNTVVNSTVQKMTAEFKRLAKAAVFSLRHCMAILTKHNHMYVYDNISWTFDVIDQMFCALNSSAYASGNRAAYDSIMNEIKLHNSATFREHESEISQAIHREYDDWFTTDYKAYLGIVSLSLT